MSVNYYIDGTPVMLPQEQDDQPINLPLLKPALAAVAGFLTLSLFPLGMALLTGPAAAGASAGFAEPLQNPLHMVLFLAVGLIAAHLGRVGGLMLPVTFLLMLSIGALTDISMAQLALSRVWLFGFVLLYAVAVGTAFNQTFLTCSSMASAFAFCLGTQYMRTAPDVASLGYFLLGNVLSVGLIICCGVSLGIATLGYGVYLRPLANRLPLLGALVSHPRAMNIKIFR